MSLDTLVCYINFGHVFTYDYSFLIYVYGILPVEGIEDARKFLKDKAVVRFRWA